MNTRQPSAPGDKTSPKKNQEIKEDEISIPKLRKNRKLELRWGPDYYNALKELVFTAKTNAYSPPEIPDKLKIDDVPETRYICKQCNDSFWIKESFDQHINRRSWILGYWCNYCFQANCSHTKEENTMCLACQKIESKNRARLNRRGLKRGYKTGSVQVFYNQCQYFAHLKHHGISSVDMTYLMLMPMPLEVENSEFDQLHEACKAIMEHAFVKQKHIADFLRTEGNNTKWWLSKASDESPIGELLKKYYVDSCDEFSDNCDNSDRENSSNPNKSGTNSDITFVDCGPTVKAFAPLIARVSNPTSIGISNSTSIGISNPTSLGPIPAKSNVCAVKPTTSFHADVPSLASLKKHHSNLKITAKSMLNSDSEVKKNLMSIFNKPSTSQATATNEGINYSNNKGVGSKIPSIVAQFPSELGKTGKIIVMNKDGDKKPDHVPRLESTGEKVATLMDNTIMSSSIPGLSLLHSGSSNSPSKLKQLPLDGKVVFRNGQKMIIRQVPSLDPTDKLNAIPRKIKLVPLTVSAANSLQPKETSVLKQPSTIQFYQSKRPTSNKSKDAQNLMMNQKRIVMSQLLSSKIVDGKLFVTKIMVNSESQQLANMKLWKSQMTNVDSLTKQYQSRIAKSLQNYSKRKIQKIIDHIKQVCRNCSESNFPDSGRIVAANLLVLEKYEKMLKTAPVEETNNPDELMNEEFIQKKRNWESVKTYRRCQRCKKKFKPSNYINGLSIPASDEGLYCQCYNYICYLCHSRQGNAQRYKAHLRFHETDPPYTCPDCFRTFSSMQHLEIHVWTKCFHIITQQVFYCRVCEIEGFLTMEDLTRHYYELHSKSAVICPDCQRVLASYSEYLKHYSENHPSGLKTPEPEDLIICEFGGCLILPENYRNHMDSHPEIGRVIYYTCPFCKFFVKTVSEKEGLIQDHVFKNHKERLPEVITPESLDFFRSKFNVQFDGKSNFKNIQSGGKIVLPKIVNTCSIPSLTFEQTSEKADYQAQRSDTTIPKIVSVRSVITTNTAAITTTTTTTKINPALPSGVTIPKIVNVQSMNPTANNSKMIYVMPSKNMNQLSSQLADRKYVIYKSVPKDSQTAALTAISYPSLAPASTTFPALTTPASTTFPTLTTPASTTFKTLTTPTYPPMPVTKVQNPKVEIMSNHQNEQSSEADDKLREFITHSLIRGKNSSDIEKKEEKIQEEYEQEENERSEEEINDDLLEKKMQIWNTAKDWQSACYKRRGRPKKPWRIALNPPENSQPYNFKCHLCYETITTSWEVIKNHFASRHYREYRLCTITPQLRKINDVEGTEAKAECKKRKLPMTTSPGSRRKRKFCGIKKTEDNSSNSGICITQEKLEEVEGTFKCKKCEELFEEIGLLREHIANKHRIKAHFLVCLECGENFVVANSLQMHLKAFHGITDPVSYLAKNSLYAPATGGFSDRRTIEPNQCYVCMAVFEDKSAVDKHLRVHGMAFLNHTRSEARNAPKPDDKKNEAEKPPGEIQKSQRDAGNNRGDDESILTRISMLLS